MRSPLRKSRSLELEVDSPLRTPNVSPSPSRFSAFAKRLSASVFHLHPRSSKLFVDMGGRRLRDDSMQDEYANLGSGDVPTPAT